MDSRGTAISEAASRLIESQNATDEEQAADDFRRLCAGAGVTYRMEFRDATSDAHAFAADAIKRAPRSLIVSLIVEGKHGDESYEWRPHSSESIAVLMRE
jgi:hypothetical protein